jgi:processive 1,2-diacylglycerol beta-glucosyltransferase
VKKLIEERDPSVKVIIKNAQDFMPGQMRSASTKFFNTLQGQLPKTYTWFFEFYMKLGSKVESIGNLPMAQYFDLEALKNYVEEKHPSLVIDTWPHINEAMAYLKKKGQFRDLPVFWVHTDSVASTRGKPEYFEKTALAVNMAYVPSKDVAKKFVELGVPAENVKVSGMPVSLAYRPPMSVEQREARKIAKRKELSLPDQRTIMIEGGRNGVGNYPLMIGDLAHESGNAPLTIIAGCGENARQLEEVKWLAHGVGNDHKKAKILRNRLKGLRKIGVSKEEIESWIKNGLPDHVTLKPLGFTPLADWRYASDAVATKPGGLSTAEMASEGIPMVLRAETASGQELHNVRFFVDNQLAVRAVKEIDTARTALELANDSKFLRDLSEKSEEFRASFQLEVIARDAVSAMHRHTVDRSNPRFSENPVKKCIFKALRSLK